MSIYSIDEFETLVESCVDGVSFLEVFKALIESCIDGIEVDSLMIDEGGASNDPENLESGHPENLGGGLEGIFLDNFNN